MLFKKVKDIHCKKKKLEIQKSIEKKTIPPPEIEAVYILIYFLLIFPLL